MAPASPLDQIEELRIVNRVDLVKRDHQAGDAHLTGEQHVLPRLGHRAVGGGHHEDGAVDLGRARDHVLDVVGVPGHVDVRVVPVRRLVLDVGDVDRDAPLPLLRRLVDLVEARVLGRRVLVVQDLGDRRGQGRLAVVDVTHRPDVEVRLGPLELRLAHVSAAFRVMVVMVFW